MVDLQKNEQELTQSVMSKISLSKDKEKLEAHVVNLSKCVVDLSKKNNVDLGATNARVVVVLDYSGSMRDLYSDGDVQAAINRLVPLGLTFDDNGTLDVYLFQDNYRKIDDMNINNYDEYVTKVIEKSGYSYGGTNYAPVLNAIVNGDGFKTEYRGFIGKLLGKKKEYKAESLLDDKQPTFVLFLTDGDNFDESATEKVIRESSEKNIFIQFIGIGGAGFRFLSKLDDLDGRKVDNTGFSRMKDLSKATDSELYTNVLGQYAEWLNVTKDWRV